MPTPLLFLRSVMHCVACLVLCAVFNLSHAGSVKVAFINPDRPGNPFWDQVNTVMQAAADDLDLELQIVFAEEDRYQSIHLLKELITSGNKPDYLVFMFQHGAGLKLLRLAEQEQIRSIMINTDIPSEWQDKVGAPRQHFKHWLGHLHPDDQLAGQLLMDTLAEQAASALPAKPQRGVVALSGSHDSSAAQKRNQGLQESLQNQPNLTLNQLVFSQWRADLASQQAARLLTRYPQSQILWAASDQMALAAAHELQLDGIQPGKDILLGGIDWTPAGIKAMREGLLHASVGGHFAEGAWALVLIHDYHHGHDFADLGLEFLTPMAVMTPANQDLFEPTLSTGNWQPFHFRQLLRSHHPKRRYEFSLQAILATAAASAP
ncbi:ABC transporter substrate-binding protein [Atopomonas sediminilitoris]|uniref:ABC transporter substrate-binding protein n=1 Tax=Atopomonas sediminilitoris TaxID=2919919 RepID=UPI001F4DD3E2|nr:ABC transporter substrate-binding protein [Atopomonas sediminilitoris]MCJ8170092.1 ABC transporter substrate-binding protein [Atopomonas sediminilitoris]